MRQQVETKAIVEVSYKSDLRQAMGTVPLACFKDMRRSIW
jgi:hypothetical protein